MLLQKLDILPAVARSREDGLRPLRSRSVQVILDLDAVRLLEMSAEHGIGETDSYTYVVRSKERVVPAPTSAGFAITGGVPHSPIVHIRRSPSKDIGIQRHEQSRKASLLCPVENRNCDLVVKWPIELIPTDTIPVCLCDVLYASAAGRAHDIWDILFGGGLRSGNLPFRVEDALDAHRGKCDREIVLLF